MLPRFEAGAFERPPDFLLEANHDEADEAVDVTARQGRRDVEVAEARVVLARSVRGGGRALGRSIEGAMAGSEALQHGVDLGQPDAGRSEEHTSELQSRENLVCRLLLEKKKST